MNQPTIKTLPKQWVSPNAYQATVVATEENIFQIVLQGRKITAQKAFSCLVNPIVQDEVLVQILESGETIITAIISRAETSATELHFENDVVVSSQGRIDIQSDDNLSLHTSQQLFCHSETALHRSKEAWISFDKTKVVMDQLDSTIDKIQSISQWVNQIARQTVQKFQTYVRHTEDMEQTKAGNKKQQVEGLYRVDTETTLMISEKDTKIDGQHIHMG